MLHLLNVSIESAAYAAGGLALGGGGASGVAWWQIKRLTERLDAMSDVIATTRKLPSKVEALEERVAKNEGDVRVLDTKVDQLREQSTRVLNNTDKILEMLK